MASEITNKKLYTEVASVFVGMDSKLVPGEKNFFIKFPASESQLKKALTDFHVLVLMDGYQNTNVTPFCLPEVQACVDGEVHLVGVPPAALDGDNTMAKFDTMNNMTWATLKPLVEASGFARKLVAGSVVATPPGMLVATLVCPNGVPCTVVRYGIMQASDYEAAHSTLMAMLQAYPYLQSTDYAMISKLVKAPKESGDN